MATKGTMNLNDALLSYMAEAMKTAIGDVFDQAIEKAAEDARAKRDKVVAETALRMSHYMTIHDMGRTVRIEIIKPTSGLEG